MDIKQIYFVGAGGIGMAALERYFMAKGISVAGYDRTPSELTDDLRAEGAQISFVDDPDEAIPPTFRSPADTLVVYTPAIPSDNRVLTYFRTGDFRVVKRAALLGEVTRDSKAICISGTHGKTTTSSMAAHILHSCPCGCNAFLGGVLRNYNSNYLLNPESPFTVIEADEYDRSFHQLRPYIAVVTSTDPDHLDIYGDEAGYLEGFAQFTELIQPGGYLIVHTGLKLKPRTPASVSTYTYSRHEGDFHAANIRHTDGEIIFDFIYPEGQISDISLGVPVEINIDNAVAALAACHLTGQLDHDKARQAIGSFLGPKRRFEFHLKEKGPNGRVIIDDYAHHPDELRASIRSVKALYPGRKLTVAFQPHLYSRTANFYREFANVLSEADEVVMVPLYPAREKPIEGISSKTIYDRVTSKKILLNKREDLPEAIKNSNFEILLISGAGDIADLVEPTVKAVLNE